ncbi:hypothetical protein O6H91_21G021300 [Diphasiastrum complanatum]|uniref:Uncharacterized protein n=1 Tax=Diphasiastrum complanatum TaxID=34168 RepID=A0ACC2AIK8_DIPCM|nr:hypothetical protein O6H91_21G021300 [Diphasiastrum complanatum]
MKKTSGAKVGLRSSVESGLSVLSAKTLSQLASCAQNRSSYALIVSVAVVPILFCCAYFDSRIVSAELLLQTANRLLLVHTSTLNLSFIRHKNEAHFRQFGERSWAPEPFQGEQTVTNNDLESGSSYQNSSINSILEKASLNYSGETKDCDLFDGRWIKDDKFHPSYSPEGCPFIDKGFRCKQNGRTDSEYFKWRWQPRGCNIPRFDARAMLVNLRGRRMVFVGDSLGRNQWESLLCMLAEAVANKSAIYEANGNPITKRKGFLSIRFDDYNCTVEYYRAPFLVRRAAAPAGSPEKVKSVLLVDAMHSTSPKWRSADVLIFNAGHWWTHEKTLKCGWYFQEGGRVVEDMKVESAFRRAMRTWGEWVKSQVDTNKTHILFRGYSPPHFRCLLYIHIFICLSILY